MTVAALRRRRFWQLLLAWARRLIVAKMAYMSFLYERLAHDMPLWMQDGPGIDSLLKAGDEMYGDNEAE